MKSRLFLLTITVFSILIYACSPDDPNVSLVPDRDRTEQQATDSALLMEYLQTHYYNSGALSAMTNPGVTNIVIDSLLTTVPPNHTLLSDAVEIRTTTFEDTEYEYFILKINQGGGEDSPKFTDRIRTVYEGSLIADDDSIFDSAVTPVEFFLTGGGVSNSLGVIRGWQLVFPEFNVASGFVTGSTTSFEDFGLGVMFLPSGLAYFSGTQLGIPSYSNLIFKFALLQSDEFDHDNDGIPSYVEDLNNNTNVLDDDSDEDTAVNYIDIDDDNDGILTRNELERTEYVVNTNEGETEPALEANEFELSRSEESGIITITTGKFADRNQNGTPDHLDAEESFDYSETE